MQGSGWHCSVRVQDFGVLGLGALGRPLPVRVWADGQGFQGSQGSMLLEVQGYLSYNLLGRLRGLRGLRS